MNAPYTAKLLDPAGRFCSSRGFDTEYQAAKQARKWSIGGATTYVMNGSIRAIYKGGHAYYPANLKPILETAETSI